MSAEELRKRNFTRRYAEVTLHDGVIVKLQSLSRADRRKVLASLRKADGTLDKKKEDFYNDAMLALMIVDPATGNYVFTIDEALDGVFDSWELADTDLLLREAVELNNGVADKAVTLRAALKNSAAIQ